MMKISFSIFLFQLIILNTSYANASCSPVIGSDGLVQVEILDANDKVIYSKKHNIINEDRYKGFVSDAGVGIKLKSKENATKIQSKSLIHFKAKGTYTKANRKDGSAIALIGGCPLVEISLLTTLKRKKEPFIHSNVLQAVERLTISVNTQTDKNAANKAVTGVNNHEKSQISHAKTTVAVNNAFKQMSSKDVLNVFGVDLGGAFTQDQVKSITRSAGGRDFDQYSVIPKKPHPYFDTYQVNSYKVLGNAVYLVRAYTKDFFCKDDDVCKVKLEALVDALSKKYGKPKTYERNAAGTPYEVIYHYGTSEILGRAEEHRFEIKFFYKSLHYELWYTDKDVISRYNNLNLDAKRRNQKIENAKQALPKEEMDSGI